MNYVIIGAGIAGVTAAKTIKSLEKNANVVLLGKERYFPYYRYKLTDFLCDDVSEEGLYYTSASFFYAHGIQFRKGEFVKSIDPPGKTIRLNHNEVIKYDKLLIATGGSPRLGPLLKYSDKYIKRYYTIEDVLWIKRRIDKIKTCIVAGEGPSTLDLIRGLSNLGKKVIYVTRNDRAKFGIVASEFDQVHKFLQERKVKIICDDQILSVEPVKNYYQALTLNQAKLKGDIVFTSDYYLPNIKFVKNSEINKKIGILVDTRLQTSVEDIYAAGDCVEVYHPRLKNYWINFGWPNALKQGEVAGKNMVGQSAEYEIHDTLVFDLMGKPLKARWWA